MLNKHLMAIANYIDKNDVVLDVGTDHAYLPIYLQKNNLCMEALASDISKNALENAQKNIEKEHLNIQTFLSDGLTNIDAFFNTLVISGMGTSSIISILDSPKIPSKIILSSNNELYRLRKYMHHKGYYLKSENVILEKNKYYSIMYYMKKKGFIKKSDLLFGKSHNKEYYKYLLQKEKDIFKKSHKFSKLINIMLLKMRSI